MEFEVYKFHSTAKTQEVEAMVAVFFYIFSSILLVLHIVAETKPTGKSHPRTYFYFFAWVWPERVVTNL